LRLLERESDEVAGVRLYSCSSEDWVEAFDEAKDIQFSPTSRELVLTLKAGGLKVVSLQDPQEPVHIWSDPAAELAYDGDFSRDGSKLLVELVEGDAAEPTIHAVDLSDPSQPFVYSLRLPTTAQIVESGESAILAWSTWAYDEPRDLLWQTLLPESLAAPVVVLSDATDDLTRFYDAPVDAGSVLLGRSSDTGTALSLLRYDDISFEETLIAELPGTIWRTAWSPDGHGLAVQITGVAIDTKVWWVTFSQAGEPSQPRLLAGESLGVSIQPWP
jgi:hypothetical protein